MYYSLFCKPILFLLLLLLVVSCSNSGLDPTPSAPPATLSNPTATPRPATPTPPQTPTPSYVPVLEPAGCPFTYSGREIIECGYLHVPEDRKQAGDGRDWLRLAVAVIKSAADNPEPDPLVYLSGGPGEFAVVGTEFAAETFRPVLAHRDVIVFDQRGVGFSAPSLDCPEAAAVFFENIERSLTPEEWTALEQEATIACRDRLRAEGINLSAYNSAASAADLHDLRQVLGYESWNIYGISYGTRLALTALRDFGHTGTIRSVVLDSVAPPQIDLFNSIGPNAHRAFSLLFDRCVAYPGCAAAYPDLETRFYALVDRLNAEPATVTVSDPVSQELYRIPFTGNDLINTTFLSMYNWNRISHLPNIITSLDEGNTLRVAEIMAETLHLHDFSSEGMNFSVNCVEEAPFNSLDAVASANQGLPEQLKEYLLTSAAESFALCDLWAVDPAGPLENEPVESDLPVLLLVGDYDPITPPAFAQQAAAHLENSYLYEFEGLTHGIIQSGRSCGMTIMTAFLDNPAAEPDRSCLEDMYFGFVLP